VANIKSQIKRNKQNERRRVRNKATRSELKTLSKRVHSAADGEAAATELRAASRALDRAASAGSIHKRTAARRKSRLAKAANAAAAS
jgi:small subunit ribosomal protein S20